MGISGAMEWWEEWQLRVLVLASLFVQWLLFLSASIRKFPIQSWLRSIIWLAYLGSDALAVYALANLFTRQRRQDCSSGKGNSILEVVWAPVLLVHLGGQDLITAYNIEDNELWTRHVVTAVSQVTVAIYVFCKSWPGSDKRLLQASILFFVPGILKCMEKPWALKSASINSLVSSRGRAQRRNKEREGRINSLEDYVQKAWAFVQMNPRCQAQEGYTVDLDANNHLPQAQREYNAVDVDLEADHQPQAQGQAAIVDLQPDHHLQRSNSWRSRLNQRTANYLSHHDQEREKVRSLLDHVDLETYNLFLDLASPYPDRLGILRSFWMFDEHRTYALLQSKLFGAYDLLYTKIKMVRINDPRFGGIQSKSDLLSFWVRLSSSILPWAAIGLFHMSRRQDYNADDVKVTYALFCCTAVLEFCNLCFSNETSYPYDLGREVSLVPLVSDPYEQQRNLDSRNNALPQSVPYPLCTSILNEKVYAYSFVGQYNLVEFFARNKRQSRKMCIVNFFNCKDFLDQHWSMKPCSSSFFITRLVHKYVKKGWKDQIEDADSYLKFIDRRGQQTLHTNKCNQDLGCILKSPFDESVLLWHIATDFCFYYMDAPADHPCATAQCIQDASGEGHGCAVWCERSPHHERAVQCREMSNYMVYLLFVNPEMLLAGTRRNLFKTANAEVEEILKEDNPPLKEIFNGKEEEIKRRLTQRIISMVQPTECKEEVAGPTESPSEAEKYPTTQEGFIHDAWMISEVLLALNDKNKIWEVIEGVWVEMLCFSASRCRGYLHAKSLGTGPELLTYIWLLLSYMGMETLPERLQRTELSSGEGNSGATQSTSQIKEMEYPSRFRQSRTHEEAAAPAAAGASTSRLQEIQPAE